jgi:hypothetical protein
VRFSCAAHWIPLKTLTSEDGSPLDMGQIDADKMYDNDEMGLGK